MSRMILVDALLTSFSCASSAALASRPSEHLASRCFGLSASGGARPVRPGVACVACDTWRCTGDEKEETAQKKDGTTTTNSLEVQVDYTFPSLRLSKGNSFSGTRVRPLFL